MTLVSADCPAWSLATTQGALLSIAAGLASWLFLEFTFIDASFWPPQLTGLLFNLLGILEGSLAPQKMHVWDSRDQKLHPTQTL